MWIHRRSEKWSQKMMTLLSKGAELQEILIPEPRELLFNDKPCLAEAAFEKTPTVIKVTRLTFEHKKHEKKQQEKKYGKRRGQSARLGLASGRTERC